MKIHGHPWSINTRKVLMALAEKGQHAELVTVMLPRGEHREPAHLALHPFAKVPVLDDAGFVLYESAAINRYLEQKYPTPALIPVDPRAAALVDQWLSTIAAYFAPHAGAVILEKIFRRYLGGEEDTHAAEAGRAGMQLALDVVDRALAKTAYLAGSELSLADIQLMPYVEYLPHAGERDAIARRPHLGAWWERVSSRETWQEIARTGPQPFDAAAPARAAG